MNTPSYLLHAVEPAEEIAEQLHQDILNRIIERILIRFERGDDYILTATDKWNIELLQDAGYLLEDIQKELASATGKMQTEIGEAMEDAGVRTLEYDDKIYLEAGLDPVPLVQSPKLISIMQRDYEATLGEWVNFTRTTANAAQQTFIVACDKAYHQAITGLISPAQAVKEALEEVVNDGVIVRYPSGHTDTIETATTRAVRTGISQASAHIQEARMDEFEVDLVLVSSHLGARPDHAAWQGKIYSRSGTSNEYPDFVDATGYGSVTGLCGANCRHSFGPWFDGMENPFEQYDSEKNQKQYELEQRQRTLERRIRNTKREVQNWDTARQAAQGSFKELIEKDYQRKAALLQKQNEDYNNFCKENGLTRRADRISIAKWDRKQAAKSRAAAKKAQKSVANSNESVTIKEKIGIQFFAKVPESKFVEYALNPNKAPDKARVFKSALGYDLDNYEHLMENIKAHINEGKFIEKGDNGHGMRYEYIMKLTGPNGKEANVLTAWIQDGDEKRMTSVYVTKREATE